jgi:hypothetical protein
MRLMHVIHTRHIVTAYGKLAVILWRISENRSDTINMQPEASQNVFLLRLQCSQASVRPHTRIISQSIVCNMLVLAAWQSSNDCLLCQWKRLEMYSVQVKRI